MTARAMMLSAAFALAVWSPAAAQDEPNSSLQATFRGSAPGGCRISAPSTTSQQNATATGLAPGSANIAVNQIVGEDGEPLGATIVMVIPATCNQAHTINLQSLNGGLTSSGPAVTGGPFRSSLAYTVTVDSERGRQVFTSSDSLLAVSFNDASNEPVTVTIQIPAGGGPLTAGAYSDELVLEFGVAG